MRFEKKVDNCRHGPFILGWFKWTTTGKTLTILPPFGASSVGLEELVSGVIYITTTLPWHDGTNSPDFHVSSKVLASYWVLGYPQRLMFYSLWPWWLCAMVVEPHCGKRNPASIRLLSGQIHRPLISRPAKCATEIFKRIVQKWVKTRGFWVFRQ